MCQRGHYPGNEALLAKYIGEINKKHSQRVFRVVNLVQSLVKRFNESENGNCIAGVVKHISLLCQTHLECCASAKGYRIKEASSTESPPLPAFSSDMFHRLSSFPETATGLTALITDTTGLFGHHMARVLAASSRWTNAYYFRSRTPQKGSVSTKIEHLRVNFLDKSYHISSLLGAIKHV
ncbi:hypothetical protein S40285_10209 [Stachybotrys chlorohalonatus IBT 40285]|uniref:Uncharacterized protein n=1 Tax=Stachybotrys chlorohalonatus (strain IBT 40285) TaxID=1283841 RepID=A0A084R1Y3_STAC4|nr:hypothetical protein S40285_10209 [Stachybotrys chlorohalonata IBT 40285]